jgi:hypothetical protein
VGDAANDGGAIEGDDGLHVGGEERGLDAREGRGGGEEDE